MRKTLMSAALMLALCCTAFAGEMHTPPGALESPQADTVQEPETQATTEDGAQGTYVQVALGLLAVLRSIL